MKKITTMAMAMMLLGGCATALVRNQATYEKTDADGVVERRTAVNTIRAFGDRAVEQNLKGSLADATAEDLSAGISEANQKSEAGIIAEGLFSVLGKGIEAAAAYLARPMANPVTVSDSESVDSADDTASTIYATEGYTAAPGADGSGIYGRPSCSRCRAYRDAHGTELVDIDVPANRIAMWDALRARGYSGTSVGLPVAIDATGYVQSSR